MLFWPKDVDWDFPKCPVVKTQFLVSVTPCTSTAGGEGSIAAQGTKISHATWQSRGEKERKRNWLTWPLWSFEGVTNQTQQSFVGLEWLLNSSDPWKAVCDVLYFLILNTNSRSRCHPYHFTDKKLRAWKVFSPRQHKGLRLCVKMPLGGALTPGSWGPVLLGVWRPSLHRH